MYTHVVFFVLHDTADIPDVVSRLQDMQGQIPELLALEAGADDPPSPRSAHLCLITRFADPAGLAAYQEHPVHQAFLSWARPRIARTWKVDFFG